MIFDQKEIIKGKKKVNLYGQQEAIDVDLKTITSNASRITEDDREITYIEALATVRAMKSNKSPSSDGYTSEFCKIFF